MAFANSRSSVEIIAVPASRSSCVNLFPLPGDLPGGIGLGGVVGLAPAAAPAVSDLVVGLDAA